ncbi:MAG: GGDEF domain-containing protein, partial [Caldimonas sp.]
RRVAAAAKACVKRPADMVARYGGEEFVLLLPDTDEAGALQLANRLRQRVLDERIDHATSDVGPLLTISVGACTMMPGGNFSAEALLREADAQLYVAKSQGRNQACGVVLTSPGIRAVGTCSAGR